MTEGGQFDSVLTESAYQEHLKLRVLTLLKHFKLAFDLLGYLNIEVRDREDLEESKSNFVSIKYQRTTSLDEEISTESEKGLLMKD